MELLTPQDVQVRVSRSLDAELVSLDDTFAVTSQIRTRVARTLEQRLFADGGGEEFSKNIELVPILLKALSDQDRAQVSVVSAKLRKQENATAIESARIISDALAMEEKVRAIPDDITAVPEIPAELELLIEADIKDTELKTNPMDFSGA